MGTNGKKANMKQEWARLGIVKELIADQTSFAQGVEKGHLETVRTVRNQIELFINAEKGKSVDELLAGLTVILDETEKSAKDQLLRIKAHKDMASVDLAAFNMRAPKDYGDTL